MTEQQIFAKCARRLLPILIAAYMVNFIDRVNVGFAALTMNRDLSFSPSVYGFGAGLLFAGIIVSQVPSTIMVARIGARRWFAVIMVIWGALSAATCLVRSPESFYALRFLLGAAEAPLIPGTMFYLSLWFPNAWRARASAAFMASVPLAFLTGGPISSLVLRLDGTGGLHGWQWLFLIEGAPALVLAAVVLRFLHDRPSSAPWLNATEKQLIQSRLAAEEPQTSTAVWPALLDLRVIALGVVYLGQQMAALGYDLWLPQIVHGLGFSNFATGFVVMLPFAASIVAMLWWGRHSDRSGERSLHVVIPLLFSAAAFIAAALAPSALIAVLALVCARVGVSAIYGPFYTVAQSLLRGPAAAAAMGLINCIGAGFGGLIGPTVVGILKQQSGGYGSGMFVLALALTMSAALVLALGRSVGAPASAPAE